MLAQNASDASIEPNKVGEGSVRCCCLPRRSTSLAIVLGVLCACTSTRYQNVTNSNYSSAEYTSDLAQCRRENSTVVSIQGYDVQEKVTVDEAKAESCMAARGWQKANK
jgi:hypothetical protein